MKEFYRDGFIGGFYQTPKREMMPFLFCSIWKISTEETIQNVLYEVFITSIPNSFKAS